MMRVLCGLKANTMAFLLWVTASVSLAANVIGQSTTAGIMDSSGSRGDWILSRL